MEFKTFNRPKGANKYCGPAVLSFVSGIDTNEAAALIRQHSGQRAVRGSNRRYVLAAFADLGVRAAPIEIALAGGRAPTLARWLADTIASRTPGRMYLVLAGHHWQLVSGRRYACGRIGEVVSIRDKRVARRSRVRQVWELTGEPTRAKAHTALAGVRQRAQAVRARSASTAAARRRLRELVASEVIALDVTDYRSAGHIWVLPGKEFARMFADPFEGDHIVHDYIEAADRAEEYARALAEVEAAA